MTAFYLIIVYLILPSYILSRTLSSFHSIQSFRLATTSYPILPSLILYFRLAIEIRIASLSAAHHYSLWNNAHLPSRAGPHTGCVIRLHLLDLHDGPHHSFHRTSPSIQDPGTVLEDYIVTNALSKHDTQTDTAVFVSYVSPPVHSVVATTTPTSARDPRHPYCLWKCR